jgi:hypothetical protein
MEHIKVSDKDGNEIYLTASQFKLYEKLQKSWKLLLDKKESFSNCAKKR